MPIRPELRRFYGREWREVTRPRILARAGGRFNAKGRYLGGAKCEQCGKPDRRRVWVWTSPACGQYWTLIKGAGQKWHYCRFGGTSGGFVLRGAQWSEARRIRVVITVAHLNHVSGEDRDENLRALCQWCHLNHDLEHHHETRATRKDASRALLADAAAEWGRKFEDLGKPR